MKIYTAAMLIEIARKKSPQTIRNAQPAQVRLPTHEVVPVTSSRHWLIRQSYRMHQQNLAFATAAGR
jgi:hypothetical protein